MLYVRAIELARCNPCIMLKIWMDDKPIVTLFYKRNRRTKEYHLEEVRNKDRLKRGCFVNPINEKILTLIELTGSIHLVYNPNKRPAKGSLRGHEQRTCPIGLAARSRM